ncbi:hypothetical protein PG993_004766 [Apiospora rasikravindrae]|uniref:Uncharacterized protein n=1 Tax=Apiospora rasikravindrae TaxID=990691 RepID=A0ABR1TDS4_9PEZI
MEAAQPIMTRWVPRAALAAAEALAKVNGKGPNPFAKRMLGPAQTILLSAPPQAQQAAAQLVGGQVGGSQAICGLCGTAKLRHNRVLGDIGILPCSHRWGSLQGDPVKRMSGLSGLSGYEQSL